MTNTHTTSALTIDASDDSPVTIIVNAVGFGYDEDNMKALGWPESFNENKKIFGTAYKRSDDIDDLTKMIEEGFTRPVKFSQKPVIEDTDCLSLIKKYKNNLYN
jgi:hypothetical protein